MQKSIIHSTIPAEVIGQRVLEGTNFLAFDNDDVKNYQDLSRIGIGLSNKWLPGMMAFAMDTIQQPVLTPNIPSLVQFLQNWLPGFVKVLTAARKIDELIGITTAGSWSDEQVVQGVLEQTGTPVAYGDLTNVPLTSWNTTYVAREVVRFELGMRVGRLEEERSARIKVNSAQEKRESCGIQLEIQRNAVGFYGYNSGNNNTYGFLNDPALPAYITVAQNAGATSTLWSAKTFLEITKDIRTAIQGLVTASQDTINPETQAFTLAVATNSVIYLTVTSDFGISVRNWMTQTYPKIRVVSAPQLNSANGGANVFYLYADTVNDSSTDDQRTFIQVVPAKFQVLGVQQMVKGYEEDYSNATAGVMAKRPYAIYRASGI